MYHYLTNEPTEWKIVCEWTASIPSLPWIKFILTSASLPRLRKAFPLFAFCTVGDLHVHREDVAIARLQLNGRHCVWKNDSRRGIYWELGIIKNNLVITYKIKEWAGQICDQRTRSKLFGGVNQVMYGFLGEHFTRDLRKLIELSKTNTESDNITWGHRKHSRDIFRVRFEAYIGNLWL